MIYIYVAISTFAQELYLRSTIINDLNHFNCQNRRIFLLLNNHVIIVYLHFLKLRMIMLWALFNLIKPINTATVNKNQNFVDFFWTLASKDDAIFKRGKSTGYNLRDGPFFHYGGSKNNEYNVKNKKIGFKANYPFAYRRGTFVRS